MNTYLNPDAIKNFTIPADKLSNTIVFKFFRTLNENNNFFLPDENYKEHNWEVIQKFNESYIYGSGSTDIYYITLLYPKDDGYIATHNRYTGQIHISDHAVLGLMFNDYITQQDIIKYKYIICDLELWQEVTSSESTGLPNDELFESFSNNLLIRVSDFEIPTNTYLNNSYIPKFANDLTGRIEATYEEFSYRPSAGQKSIRDDSAIIKSIKGNTIIWNQLHPDPQMTGVFAIDGTDGGIVDGFRRITSPDGLPTTLKIQRTAGVPHGIIGHKYLVTFTARTDGDSIKSQDNGVLNKILNASVTSEDIIHYSYIGTATTTNGMYQIIISTNATYLDCRHPQYYDLTQMFGAGNEPSTVEEFRALFPNEYYEYNAGEFRSLSADGIKTTGFNQWDDNRDYTECPTMPDGDYSLLRNDMIYVGLTRNGYADATKVQATKISNGWSFTANAGGYGIGGFIKAIPNQVYHCSCNSEKGRLVVGFYDENKKLITHLTTTNFTTPLNCAYILLVICAKDEYIGQECKVTDICVNLSHTGYRDGEYEPYKEFTRELDVIKKYFPDGMKSAGSAYDEITSTKAITRIGVVDLGELSWGISSDGTLLYSTHFGVEINVKRGINVFCPKYDAYPYYDTPKDKTISLEVGYTQSGKSSVMVRDSAYTDAAAFKTAMSGVMLYYELAEPIEVEFDEVVDLTYNVYDFGTEEIISSVSTTQFRGDIIYQFNATDTIRQNKNNINRLSSEIDRLNGTKYEINDHQIFLQYYLNLDTDVDMYTNKQGYESHNLKVLKRMFQNIDTGGDEVFFVTFNSGVNGSVGGDLHTGILQQKDGIFIADLPIGLAYDVGNHVGNSHYILFSDSELLKGIADEFDGIENLFFRCHDVTLPDKKYVDSITSNNTTLVNVTYDELIETRNSSSLIPGMWYRITDYVTTISNENTQSANHPFDVIVLATSENTLSENARAAIHDGDTYFTENGANLNAWEIKYALDNDTERFYWADATNGKGVIYYMKDEWNNECPYDFKNIQFKHPNNTTTYPYYYYTFSTVIGGVVTDHSMLQGYCYGNIMGGIRELNYNVFLNTSETSTCHSNYFGAACRYNSFGDNCASNSFENCYSNSFGDFCSSNSFGNSCNNNSFGDYCQHNSFGNNCYSNSFGDFCYYNSFGNYCTNNSFGNSCKSNSFGNSCSSNSFGNSCESNSFGNDCNFNSFRVSADTASALKDYMEYNHFDDGCSYNVIWNSGTTSSSIRLKNININRSVIGIRGYYTYINIDVLNQDYEIQVAKNSNGEIRIYNDLELFNLIMSKIGLGGI